MFVSRALACALLLLATAILPGSLAALPLTPDTFEDGTTQGWGVPGLSPNPPANVATGGPGGAGDNYLQLVATGTPAAGGRLAVLNSSQWAGNYLDAGITSISMHVNNFGPDSLVLRLLFEDFEGPGPPENLVLTLAGVIVPANSGWVSVAFDLSLANLAVDTFGTVVGAMSDVDTIRIFHNPDPTFPGPGVGIPPVNVTLGVDDITTHAVPEPSTLALLGGGLAAAVARRRQRRTDRRFRPDRTA
jgi:hypothetical protein